METKIELRLSGEQKAVDKSYKKFQSLLKRLNAAGVSTEHTIVSNKKEAQDTAQKTPKDFEEVE